jgi:hypothetical protein
MGLLIFFRVSAWLDAVVLLTVFDDALLVREELGLLWRALVAALVLLDVCVTWVGVLVVVSACPARQTNSSVVPMNWQIRVCTISYLPYVTDGVTLS